MLAVRCRDNRACRTPVARLPALCLCDRPFSLLRGPSQACCVPGSVALAYSPILFFSGEELTHTVLTGNHSTSKVNTVSTF